MKTRRSLWLVLVMIVGFMGSARQSHSQTISVSPTTLQFGDVLVGATSPAQTVQISDICSCDFSLNITSITSNNPAFVLTPLTPPSPVTLSSPATFSVAFQPQTVGPVTGVISIASDDPNTSVFNINITNSTGDGAIDTPRPGGFSFGQVLVGSTSPSQTLRLTNTGNIGLVLNSITPSDPAIVLTNLPPLGDANAIDPGGSVSFNVAFSPTAAGPFNGNIIISSSDVFNPILNVFVSGTGLVITFAASPPTLNFGNQHVGATSAPMTVTLQNTGAAAVNVGSVVASSTVIGIAGDPQSVAPQSTASFTATFTPTAVGPFTGNIVINSDALGLPVLTIPVTGVGTSPKIGINPPALDFGSQLTGIASAPQTVTLQNTGNETLVISAITSNNPSYLLSSLPTTIAAGSSGTFSVSFDPVGGGTINGNISIASNDVSHPLIGVSVTGTGISPPVNTVITVVNPSLSTSVADHQATADVAFAPPATALDVNFPIQLGLQFTSSNPLFPNAQDGTIQFNPPVPANYGIPAGQLSSPPESFFTGTLAGTITVTAENGAGGLLGQSTLTVPATPPVITQLGVTTTSSSIQLNVAGFDPTRSVSQATFTFLGPTGNIINPGPISISVAAPFSAYFSSPAAQAVGSQFLLTVTFSVTGNISDISAVQVSLSNSEGTSAPQTLQFSAQTQSFGAPKSARGVATSVAVMTPQSKTSDQSDSSAGVVLPPLMGAAIGSATGELGLVEGTGEHGVVQKTPVFPGKVSLVRNSPTGDGALIADNVNRTLSQVEGIVAGSLQIDTHPDYPGISMIAYSRDGSRAVLAVKNAIVLRAIQNLTGPMTEVRSFQLPEVSRTRLMDIGVSNDGQTAVAVYAPARAGALGRVLALRAGHDERAAIVYPVDDPVTAVISANGQQLDVADNGAQKLLRIDNYSSQNGTVEDVLDFSSAGITGVTSLALKSDDSVAALLTQDARLLLLAPDPVLEWKVIGAAQLPFQGTKIEFLKSGAVLVQNDQTGRSAVIAPSFLKTP